METHEQIAEILDKLQPLTETMVREARTGGIIYVFFGVWVAVMCGIFARSLYLRTKPKDLLDISPVEIIAGVFSIFGVLLGFSIVDANLVWAISPTLSVARDLLP